MRMRTVEISVGAFLLAGIFALILLALRVSGLSASADHSSYRLYAEFDNVGSLTKRAKVAMGGVTIGRVVHIELDKKTYMARVVMDIESSVDNIPVDSSAAILTAGLLGEKFIGISVGGSQEFLKDDETVDDTQSAIVLEDLIGKFLLGSVGKDDDSSDSF